MAEVFDAHRHLGVLPAYPFYGGPPVRPDINARATVRQLVADLDAEGTARALVLPNYGVPDPAVAFSFNELCLEAAATDDRIRCGLWVSPRQADEAPTARALALAGEPGVRALKLSFLLGGRPTSTAVRCSTGSSPPPSATTWWCTYTPHRAVLRTSTKSIILSSGTPTGSRYTWCISAAAPADTSSWPGTASSTGWPPASGSTPTCRGRSASPPAGWPTRSAGGASGTTGCCSPATSRGATIPASTPGCARPYPTASWPTWSSGARSKNSMGSKRRRRR